MARGFAGCCGDHRSPGSAEGSSGLNPSSATDQIIVELRIPSFVYQQAERNNKANRGNQAADKSFELLGRTCARKYDDQHSDRHEGYSRKQLEPDPPMSAKSCTFHRRWSGASPAAAPLTERQHVTTRPAGRNVCCVATCLVDRSSSRVLSVEKRQSYPDRSDLRARTALLILTETPD